MLDDDLNFCMEISALALNRECDDIAKELYRTLCFACGWNDAYAADDEELGRHLNEAYTYIGWKRS